jgi:hypothetical protein
MKLHNSTLEAYSPSVDQGVGYFSPRLLDNPSEGGPRYVHLPGRFLLAETFQIGQPHGFKLVHGEHGQADRANCSGLRYEAYPWGIEADPTGLYRTRHSMYTPGSSFEHMLIINIGRFHREVKKRAAFFRKSCGFLGPWSTLPLFPVKFAGKGVLIVAWCSGSR